MWILRFSLSAFCHSDYVLKKVQKETNILPCCVKRDHPLYNVVPKHRELHFPCECYVASLLLQVSCSSLHFTQGKKKEEEEKTAVNLLLLTQIRKLIQPV